LALHALVLAASFCAAQPAIDRVAGEFPNLPLPAALALTIFDVTCTTILRVPTVTNLVQILGDVETVAGDVRQRRLGR
jgi:hypothetical protein